MVVARCVAPALHALVAESPTPGLGGACRSPGRGVRPNIDTLNALVLKPVGDVEIL